MLEISNLSKTYRGGKKAIENISLNIESGDIYGFIGHNGAGKTTTLKAVAGIIDYEGVIIFDGENIKINPVDSKRKMAYIPDNPDLYEHLTAIQYLNFISDIYRVEKEEKNELIKEYSNVFAISDNLGELISSYSHGMKQKLAIISALIHKPKLLLLDEPFVGLDPVASHTVKEILKKECKRGMAVFFSTHVLEVAEKICNKIAIIKNGQIIVQGKTEDVKGNLSLEDVFMELIEK